MAVGPQKAKRATVNETLRDRGIAHAVYLERLKGSVAADIVQQLDDEVIPDLVDKLTARLARIAARGTDLRPQETQRLRDTLTLMEETVEAWSTGLSSDLTDRSKEIGLAEVLWQDSLIATVLPITWDTLVPPTGILHAAILESPIDGVLLKDIVGRLDGASKTALERAIRIGIAEGESIDAIAGRIGKAVDYMRGSAEAVARTAVGHASNMGRQSYYAANDDLIAKVQFVATLDTRTCQSCAGIDGKTFPLDSGPRPPRHINCRCTTVPVLKSLRSLGFDVDDFEPATRASMNGQVSGAVTYNDWLKRMPPSIQDEALGPTRAQLFRTGKLDVRDYTDRQGELYTLDELAKREKTAWQAAHL